MTKKQLTPDEKLDSINRKMKRMEASTHLQTAIAVIGFLSLLGFIHWTDKLKKKI